MRKPAVLFMLLAGLSPIAHAGLTILTIDEPPTNYQHQDEIIGIAVDVVRKIQEELGGLQGDWRTQYFEDEHIPVVKTQKHSRDSRKRTSSKKPPKNGVPSYASTRTGASSWPPTKQQPQVPPPVDMLKQKAYTCCQNTDGTSAIGQQTESE